MFERCVGTNSQLEFSSRSSGGQHRGHAGVRDVMGLVPERFAGGHETGVPDREPIRARKGEVKPLVVQIGTTRLIQHETAGEPATVLGCVTAHLALEANDLVAALVPWQRHERRTAFDSG